MFTKLLIFCSILVLIKTITARENLNRNKNNFPPYIFQTKNLPEDLRLMPTIGNGHISYTILSNAIYMNGLYNGQNGLSHRAQIPNLSNIVLLPKSDQKFRVSYSLNVRTGVFHIYRENSEIKIIQMIYAHRYYTRVIVNQIYIYRLQGNGEFKINIRQDSDQLSEDINFKPTQNFTTTTYKDEILLHNNQHKNDKNQFNSNDYNEPSNNYYYQKLKPIRNHNSPSWIMKYSSDHIDSSQEDSRNSLHNDHNNYNNTVLLHQKEGYTKEVEHKDYQKSKQHVCCIWNHVPDEIILAENQQSVSYKYFVAVDDLCSVAKQEIKDVLQIPIQSLLKSHHDQWKKFWDTITITTTGNSELGKTIYGSLFYLASALPSFESNQPNNLYFGLSPTGLGRGGDNLQDYQGHNFWDTEIWMLPTVTQMDPRWTKQLLNYRYRMLDIAKDNAKNDGYKGAKFPWESAFTGTETTNPCCPLVALLQHHITADISFALQHYFSVTYDSEWLHNEGCKLAENIAEFWASRVQLNTANFDDYGKNLQQHYDIKYVMGPDEDHPNVTNNVFTNVVASYALRFGELAKSICNSNQMPNKRPSSKWIEIADNLKILYDNINDYHPQYEGYTINTTIKQADTILLGYPLMLPMNDSTRENDLRIYEKVTRKTGPAMTWAMHAINHLDIGEFDKAELLFNRSYQDYIRPPFQVFSEVIINKTGAVNFLTGAGGFLQSIINGYAGVRIFIDRMEIIRPRVTPSSSKLTISGIKYLGSTFKISATFTNESIIQCTSTNLTHPLILHDAGKQLKITTNLLYHITSRRIVIKPQSILFYDWR